MMSPSDPCPVPDPATPGIYLDPDDIRNRMLSSHAAYDSGLARIWSKLRTVKRPKQAKSTGPKPKRSARRGPEPRKTGKGKNTRRSRSLIWRLARWTLSIMLWGCMVVGLILGWFALDLPRIDLAAAMTRKPSITLVDENGAMVATYGDQYGDVVPVNAMSHWLPEAVMSIEDRRFYSHPGIDPLGLLRAVVTNWQAGQTVQGGSTITQQTAKNLFLTRDRTFKRKAQELMLALWLEWTFSKDQIFSLYLNRVYLGAGTYGMEAAARKYFGVSTRHVTPYQAAVLAGLLKAPSRYNPENNKANAHARARTVLQSMVASGVLTQAQAEHASSEGERYLASLPPRSHTGRYFSDFVLDQLDNLVGTVDTDLVVRTTFNKQTQKSAEHALNTVLNQYGATRHATQGAVVVMSPHGAVRAIVGGTDYSTSQYNRATQATRQPGSSFKTFVYLAALEQGLSPDDIIQDEPLTIRNWSPQNFDRQFRGDVTVREAVARSINTVAVRVAMKTGLRTVARTARRLGLSVSRVGEESPAMALGTEDNTLLAMTAAYAPLANGGMAAYPYSIIDITTRDGQVLYERIGTAGTRVIRPDVVAQMNQLLGGVLSWGTGKAATLDRPAGAKTGTSQTYRDALYLGYTADYVTGVWIGNDDNSPMKRVTGGTLPAQVWKQVMEDIHRGLPARPIPSSGSSSAPDYDRDEAPPATWTPADEIDRLQDMFGRR
ncbi:PBP1A family penicillin-binding protein [Haematospirillum jordaniae]|uniref:Uncharacterized protein n=1 Tax=Haematospirillum jordaniae TaxID=1549855 RepID=A0A143DDC8_9PROT|nr:PBP1A family penicillin-binding protein [Haematospirillum jordaniae]AMW34540.1 hypothetical protein AY555_04375 [Haematospirillum jordaniae]NKD44895.1 PBP1A family penicillin-binding protein [Haematospirillum jordaniae]NKD57920.1 PBP1A family penicillin-binding protein [Haematospirillum jordaniae]NKD59968.1 PBP1A family penicillin-binding protein [Haematospirillum jordaniae]NKD67906.1 PBP1A family penicillin-binding protein [Haematospirillum jordaniae]